MEYQNELNEYAGILKSQREGIDRILAIAANSNGLVGRDVEEKLINIRKKVEMLHHKLVNNEFEIAIVGVEKAGKSTFANAMMGNDILPSKDARCTYTSTSIRYGEDQARVEFFTRDEFEKSFREKLELLGIEHAGTFTFDTLSLDNYQERFLSLDKDRQNYYGGTVNKDIEDILTYKENLSKFLGTGTKEFYGVEELEGNYFKGFIQDPAYAIAVKEITLSSSKLSSMKNAIIYDVPGFDSPTQMHKDQTVEKMRRADAIVLIASACKPSFTGPLVDIFRTESDYDGIRFGDKMFVFANMADMANTLDENIDIIRKDLDKHRIMDIKNHNRIIPGSARAKLEAEGKVDGSSASQALKEKGIGNGIDEITRMLEKYNQTERFSILKAKINRVQTDIYDVFKGMFEKQDVSAFPDVMLASSEITTKILMEAKHAIKEELDTYRYNLRKDFNQPLSPITNKMKSKIIAGITVDNYGVTEEELEEARKHADITTTTDIIAEMDSYLRKAKYLKMYNEFSEGVVNLAIDEHSKCDKEIKDIFINGLGIGEDNPYYKEIVSHILDYLDQQKDSVDDKGYYKSLIERFSVDLFEILIRLSYGDMSRWNRFADGMSNFYSLSMFDSNRDISLTPDKQPLHYLLLFHDREQHEVQKCVGEIAGFLKESLEIVVDPMVLSLVKKIAKIKKSDALKFIEEMFKNTERKKDAQTKYDIVLGSLESKVDKFRDEGLVMDELELSEEFYEKFFMGKRNKTPKELQAEINEDIEILQKTLEDTVVNAICIEKAFLALQVHSIENMIQSLDSDKFREFVVRNAQFIAVEKYKNLEKEEQKKLVHKNISDEIKNILDQMKHEGIQEEV